MQSSLLGRRDLKFALNEKVDGLHLMHDHQAVEFFFDGLELIFPVKSQVKVVVEYFGAFDFEGVGILDFRNDFEGAVFSFHSGVEIRHEIGEFLLLFLRAFGTLVVSFFLAGRLVLLAGRESEEQN